MGATEATPNLVDKVKEYALVHYNDGGWDVIVECWDNTQIAEAITGATTLTGAIRKLGPVIGVYSDRQADANNSLY